jgi:hypothetical protein
MEMREGMRWLLAVAIVLAVVGLIAYARGPEHHHGDEVGALPSGVAVARGLDV